MKKVCPSCQIDLNPAMTLQGVEIDMCPQCAGIWFDRDEFFHFAKDVRYVTRQFKDALERKVLSPLRSPVADTGMVELSLFNGKVFAHYCIKSHGIWLEKAQRDHLPADKINVQIDLNLQDGIEAGQDKDIAFSLNPELSPLPSLAVSSSSVLIGLYAVLSLALIFAGQFLGLGAGTAFLIAFGVVLFQFIFGPFIMDLSLKWLYRVQWIRMQSLPEHLQLFIHKMCQTQKIKMPRIGLIMDGAPQAFTYGHHPNNGRIVISHGLIDLLDEEELETVVAHEIGHMVHWDMVLMTAAQLVPMAFYYIYRTLLRYRSRSSREDKSAAARYVIAMGAFVLYIISEYVVLWFSRIREYYADRFAGQVTKKPEKLASALVKIGYGLAGRKPVKTGQGESTASVGTRGLEPLGIFNAKHASALALSSQTGAERMGGEIDKDVLCDAAKWDLWNPWAAYFELHSTHPLIAKRIQKLSNLSVYLGKKPYIEFNDRKPESYWDDFLIDVCVHLMPRVIFIAGVIYTLTELASMTKTTSSYIRPEFPFTMLAFFVFLTGLSSLFKVFYSYPLNNYIPMNVRALLKKIKVSAVKPVPCRIKGKIIGRGVPGLIYSEDFVLQDDTGIIFLDYQQPLGLFNFLFGLLRAGEYQDREVEIIGWYRRAPIPYIEIRDLKCDGKVSRCYTYQWKMVSAVMMILFGIVLLFI